MDHKFTPQIGDIVESLPEEEYWGDAERYNFHSKELSSRVGLQYKVETVNKLDIQVSLNGENQGFWNIGRFKLVKRDEKLTYSVVALKEHMLSLEAAINKAKKNTNEFGTTFLVVDSNGIIVGATSQVARVEYTPIVKK